MLGVIVFLCGACLMGLELVAARVLAPALGNSIFVWGAVISTVMTALSLGYWLGGQIADRFRPAKALPVLIAGGGLLAVAVPLVASFVLEPAAQLGPRLGSLVASALLFFAPALLLATVSPLAVRLAAEPGLERLGRTTGNLYAISTAGSIVGTLATAFWLIPVLSLEPLLIGIGFTLFAVSSFAAGYARVISAEPTGPDRTDRALAWTTTGLIVVGVTLGVLSLLPVAPSPAKVPPGERVVLKRDTQYHRLLVTEDLSERNLRFDRSLQSSMFLSDPYGSSIKYPSYLHLALAAKPDAKRVLVIGLGGGTVVKRMWRDYPEMTVDVVEIDPAVAEVAKRYFALPDDPRVRVHVQDGRRFIQTSDETYDIIIIDAYYADALPSHLTTQEFFGEVEKRLTPGGVVAYNIISSVEGDGSRLFRSMYRTADSVWDNLFVFPIGLGLDGVKSVNRNIIMLATDSPLARDELVSRIDNRVSGRVSVPRFDEFDDDLYTGVVQLGDVPLLTDSHAPTDSLIEVN